MPIDVEQAGSDGWWLQRLTRKLADRQDRLERLDSYFRGEPPLPEDAKHVREAYEQFQKKARLNIAELACESARERMKPLGFRILDSDEDDVEGDSAARTVWEDNDLDVESAEVHSTMLRMGDAYVIVGEPDETGSPVITAEDPRQVVTIHDPVRQRNIRAAAKVFHDPDEGRDYAYLYKPGDEDGPAYVRVATRERNARTMGVQFNPRTWDWDDDRSGELPFDRMPVVRFRNRRGMAEFEAHTDLLDRINTTILDRLVIQKMQAYKQRAIEDAPILDEETGKEIDYADIFTADPGVIWRLPAGSKLWESSHGDIQQILSAVKDDLRDGSAVMRFPLYMVSPDAAVQSAEGASLQREGLTYRTEDRIIRVTSTWLDVMGLAFAYLGDEQRSRRGAFRMLWAPVERYSLAERADAASKAGSGDKALPFETIATDIWQFSPAEVERMQAQRATDTFLNAAGQLQSQPQQTQQPQQTATGAPAEGTVTTT